MELGATLLFVSITSVCLDRLGRGSSMGETLAVLLYSCGKCLQTFDRLAVAGNSKTIGDLYHIIIDSSLSFPSDQWLVSPCISICALVVSAIA